jgi:hypothetical protein
MARRLVCFAAAGSLALAGCGISIAPRGMGDMPGSLEDPGQTTCVVYVRNASLHDLDVSYVVHGRRNRQGNLGRLRRERTGTVQAPCMASVTATGEAPGYSTSGSAMAEDVNGAWIYLR